MMNQASVLPYGLAECLAGEGASGVEVHGQALPGVEQLDEQARVGAEALDVLGAQVGLGLGGDGVAHQRAVREPAEPALVVPERGVGGADPLLRHVIGVEVQAAQGRDPGAAGVEVAQHVGRQDLRLHGGGTSPDPRTTSSVGTTTWRGGWSPPSSRAKASAAAWAPICWLSWRTTVAGTASRSASSKSSKPTSARPWGAVRRARSAPTALRLLPANSAVGRRSGGSASSSSRRARPAPRRACRGGSARRGRARRRPRAHGDSPRGARRR